jgi:predicted ester cyclase
MIAENKAMVERFLDEWIGEGRRRPVNELLEGADRQHARGAFAWHLLQATLSDAQFEAEHVIAEDSFVVVLGKFSGLQRRSLFGASADGRGITVRVAFAFRIEDRRVKDYWVEFEPWSLLEQLDINALAEAPHPSFGTHSEIRATEALSS